jgi:hypothetical protein
VSTVENLIKSVLTLICVFTFVLWMTDAQEIIVPTWFGSLAFLLIVQFLKAVRVALADLSAWNRNRLIDRDKKRRDRHQREREMEYARSLAKQPPPPSQEDGMKARLEVLKQLHEIRVARIRDSGMADDAKQAVLDLESRRYESEIQNLV